MRLNIVQILVFLIGGLIAHSLQAGVITSAIDFEDDWPFTSVDVWNFQQRSDGVSAFDILAYERDPISERWIDLNKDGHATYLDSMIWLFEDDGDLGWDDLVNKVDDSLLGSDSNGSLADPERLTTSLDPYMSLYLTAGDYILLVSGCCGNDLNLEDMNQFYDDSFYHPVTGDYALHYSGDIKLVKVSEPISSLYFGVLILCLYLKKSWFKYRVI